MDDGATGNGQGGRRSGSDGSRRNIGQGSTATSCRVLVPRVAGDHDEREVGNRSRVDVGHGVELLGAHRGPLDVHRSIETVRGLESASDGREVATELHDDRTVGVGQAAGELGLGQCAGQNSQHVGLPDQGSGGGGRRGGEGRNAGDDLGLEMG